jgi:starch synthase
MLPRLLDWPVDVIHSHDAEACPAMLYRRQWFAGRQLPGVGGTLLTIHNLAHQEINPQAGVHTLGLPEAMVKYPGVLEFHGQLNLLKAGILSADLVNTVSPTYARETTMDPDFGCGLDGVLLSRKKDYSGILNGADYDTWSTRGNKALPAAYDAGDMTGKDVCRKALIKELGLKVSPGKPVCGLVGRLVQQKGIDLVIPLMQRLVDDGFTFAILGTGEKRYETALRKLADSNPAGVAYVQEFNEDLAHRIYAGSDLFLMPSHFEPCGLSQLYALRYGTPPVVRQTGGLADTVKDATTKNGTGFIFKEATSPSLLAALRQAEKVFTRPEQWRELQLEGMACDYGWETAAAKYEVLYQSIAADGKK